MLTPIVPVVLSLVALGSDDAGASSARHVQAKFDAAGEYEFKSDFKDSAGSVGVARFGGALDVDMPIGERSSLVVSAGSQYSHYDFNDATGFGAGGKPWDNTIESQITAIFKTQADGHWAWFAGVGVDSSEEVGADFGDSLTFGGTAGASYEFSDRLTLGVGVLAFSRLEDSALVLPFPIVEWKIAEKWSLSSSVRHGRTGGLALNFAATDQWTFSLEGSYIGREFRLDDTSSSPDGVGRDQHITAKLRATWTPGAQVEVDAFVGMDVWQQYTLDNTNGSRVAEFDAKSAPVIGLGATFKF